MSPRDRAIVVHPDEGRRYSLGSALQLCFKADEREADGSYSISIATAGPDHPGTTPHIHRQHDDVSFVIEGTLAYEVAGTTFEAPMGALVIVPRGLPHRWWNPRPEPLAFLNIHIPGAGFENMIRELAQLSAEGRASPAALLELGARYDGFFDEEALSLRHSG